MAHTENEKTHWISDHLHHTVNVSALERLVISSRIFHRLHNILQNSTVYFTYPSARTSRFSHSLGCMRIAGDIFRYSILNATPETRKSFFAEAAQALSVIEKSDSIHQGFNEFFRDIEDSASFTGSAKTALAHPVYTDAQPGSFLDEEDRPLYNLIFQSLRFGALLHDLGHPPFSHITESALHDIYERIFNERDSGKEISSRERYFLEVVGDYRSDHKAFHEELGVSLTKWVLLDLVRTDGLSDELRYCTIVIKELTLAILQDKETPGSNIFSSLHRIFDGKIDSDRLDYVPRDLSMSGISRESLRYDRLLSSFELTRESGEEKDSFGFTPSTRALSTLEDFFHRRFNLYKYVVFHHRVAKTDGLLKQSIIEIADQYLATQETPPSQLKSGKSGTPRSHLLPNNISGLWLVLDPQLISQEEIVSNYIQWDDAWLLSMLRRKYFRLKQEGSGREQELLYVRLEEILSNRKNYHSLFKRADTFSTADNAFLSSIPDRFSWDTVADQLGLSEGVSAARKELEQEKSSIEDLDRANNAEKKVIFFLQLHDYFEDYKKIGDDAVQLSRLRERHGFFIVALIRVLASVGRLGAHGAAFLDAALDQLKDKFSLADSILIQKNIEQGISNSHRMLADDKLVPLGQVSRIADELERAARQFPPFYVYLFKEKGFDPTEDYLLEMRSFLGNALWRSFHSQLMEGHE